MSPATAPATQETPYTPRELAQVAHSSCNCAAAMAWRAVAEFQISVYSNRQTGAWFATRANVRDAFHYGASPLEAVEKILRQMGGTNGS